MMTWHGKHNRERKHSESIEHGYKYNVALTEQIGSSRRNIFGWIDMELNCHVAHLEPLPMDYYNL